MKKFRWLKLAAMALLTMVVLVIISIIEVAIYSYLIDPGKPAAVYDAHAMVSAPWISAIFGFIVFFLVVRYWGNKGISGLLPLAVQFVLTYIAIDLVILLAFGVEWGEFLPVFLAANGAKLLGALTAVYFYRRAGGAPSPDGVN